jgi:hypothetical protein
MWCTSDTITGLSSDVHEVESDARVLHAQHQRYKMHPLRIQLAYLSGAERPVCFLSRLRTAALVFFLLLLCGVPQRAADTV